MLSRVVKAPSRKWSDRGREWEDNSCSLHVICYMQSATVRVESIRFVPHHDPFPRLWEERGCRENRRMMDIWWGKTTSEEQTRNRDFNAIHQLFSSSWRKKSHTKVPVLHRTSWTEQQHTSFPMQALCLFTVLTAPKLTKHSDYVRLCHSLLLDNWTNGKSLEPWWVTRIKGGGYNLPLSSRHKGLLSTGQHANDEHCYQSINLMSWSPQYLIVSKASNAMVLLWNTTTRCHLVYAWRLFRSSYWSGFFCHACICVRATVHMTYF